MLSGKESRQECRGRYSSGEGARLHEVGGNSFAAVGVKVAQRRAEAWHCHSIGNGLHRMRKRTLVTRVIYIQYK